MTLLDNSASTHLISWLGFLVHTNTELDQYLYWLGYVYTVWVKKSF
jgi:hypothetical protein